MIFLTTLILLILSDLGQRYSLSAVTLSLWERSRPKLDLVRQ